MPSRVEPLSGVTRRWRLKAQRKRTVKARIIRITVLSALLVSLSVIAVRIYSCESEKVDLKGQAQVSELMEIVLPERCMPSPCARLETVQERANAVKKYVNLLKRSGVMVDLRGANL